MVLSLLTQTGQTTPLSFRMASSGRSWDSGSKSGTYALANPRATVKAAAVDQTVASRRVADAGYKQQGGYDHLGVLRLRDAVGVPLHRAARVPGMSAHGLVHLVDHRQADAARLRLLDQLAVFFPAVQRRQGTELAFDGPVGVTSSKLASPTTLEITEIYQPLRLFSGFTF